MTCAPRDVTNDHVQALVKLEIEAGYSVQTAIHIRNAISAVFNHAKLKRAHTGDNLVHGVRLPEMSRKETHALTFDEGPVVLANLPSPVMEMVLLSMTTSLNVAEMLGLRWMRVNLTAESRVMACQVLQPFSLTRLSAYARYARRADRDVAFGSPSPDGSRDS